MCIPHLSIIAFLFTTEIIVTLPKSALHSHTTHARFQKRALNTMAGKKIIAVFGATGQQGGSVVDIFLNDPKLKNEWSVRAVTRDITKESAKKLAAQGAEVVQVRRLPEATVTWREDQNVELIPVDRPTCRTRRHWAMPSLALKPCLP